MPNRNKFCHKMGFNKKPAIWKQTLALKNHSTLGKNNYRKLIHTNKSFLTAKSWLDDYLLNYLTPNTLGPKSFCSHINVWNILNFHLLFYIFHFWIDNNSQKHLSQLHTLVCSSWRKFLLNICEDRNLNVIRTTKQILNSYCS